MSGVKIYDGEKFVNFNISNGIELPVGFEYYVPYSELDSGQLIRDGQIVSRSVYKDLWDFVQKHPSLLLTEEQWQAELSANEGVVNNYYSSGDGSTTFRLPKAGVIELPVITAENINKFSTDTQRNILGRQVIGSISSYSPTNGDFVKGTTGAFYGIGRQYISNSVWSNDIAGSSTYINPDPTTNVPSGMNTGDTFLNNINFDASKSIGAEHTGNEVKPKTITKLAVVQAFGRVINTGTLDIADIADQLLNMVTIDTTQTITGVKSFNKTVNFNYYTNFNYAFTVDVAAKFNNQIRIKDGQSLVWLDTNDATLASINKSNYTGNANTATKLEIARTINGIAFDGSADITIPEQVQYGTTDLTAGTSSLATGRIYCVYE